MNRKIRNIINKKNKSKIICLTAYSKNIAEIIDNHADIVLVGDSLGSVLYNYDTTRKVTLKMMVEHTKSVRMGVKKSLLVIDLPYNTYRNKSEALKNVWAYTYIPLTLLGDGVGGVWIFRLNGVPVLLSKC